MRVYFASGASRGSVAFETDAIDNVKRMISDAIIENEYILTKMIKQGVNAFSIALVVYSTAGYNRMLSQGAYFVLDSNTEAVNSIRRLSKEFAVGIDALFTADEIEKRMRSNATKRIREIVKYYIRTETEQQLMKLYTN